MFMLAGYVLFNVANMIAFHKVNVPEFGMIPVGTILSLVGMGIGFGINRLVSWRRRRARALGVAPHPPQRQEVGAFGEGEPARQERNDA